MSGPFIITSSTWVLVLWRPTSGLSGHIQYPWRDSDGDDPIPTCDVDALDGTPSFICPSPHRPRA